MKTQLRTRDAELQDTEWELAETNEALQVSDQKFRYAVQLLEWYGVVWNELAFPMVGDTTLNYAGCATPRIAGVSDQSCPTDYFTTDRRDCPCPDEYGFCPNHTEPQNLR